MSLKLSCWVWGLTIIGDRPPKSIEPEANFIPEIYIYISLRITKLYQLAETTARVGFLRLWQLEGGYEPLFIVRGKALGTECMLGVT